MKTSARLGQRTPTARGARPSRSGIAVKPPRYGIDFIDAQARSQPTRFKSAPSCGSTPSGGSGSQLPPVLRSHVESLSGADLTGVRVHYDSQIPAVIDALAYTQGKDIHLGPGQERHLSHEAWHAVQNAQGRVKPMIQTMDGLAFNNDSVLEHEADVMGTRATTMHADEAGPHRAQPLSFTAAPNTAIQRKIQQATRERDPDKKNKWYSTLGPEKYFDSREQAQAHEDQIKSDAQAARVQKLSAQSDARAEQYQKRYSEEFSGYEPPPSENARVFKTPENELNFDEMKIVKPESPAAVKAYAKHIFLERRAKRFRTQVMKLSGEYYVLAPGTDIGLTPARLRPDLSKSSEHVPLSREGRPKTYPEIAAILDKEAQRLSELTKASIKQTRSRMGKDLERLSRDNPPKKDHIYGNKALKSMRELSSVLRLDKGRVPSATRYIRTAFTKGNLSFAELLKGEQYLGAGKGGVENLRHATPKGEESEGSDIEQQKSELPKRKRKGRDDSRSDEVQSSPKRQMLEQQQLEQSEILELEQLMEEQEEQV
jgi:hypothetical protein